MKLLKCSNCDMPNEECDCGIDTEYKSIKKNVIYWDEAEDEDDLITDYDKAKFRKQKEKHEEV